MRPVWEGGGVRLYHGDCREVLPKLAERGVWITDPPYSEHVHGKSRAGARKLGGNAAHGTAHCNANISRSVDFGFEHLSPDLRAFVATQAGRLAGRWALFFSDVESCHLWREDLAEAGLDYVRTGVWHKQCSTPQFTGDRPAVAVEAITICHPKGRKRWNGGGGHAFWSHAIVLGRGQTEGEPRLHPTQKPEGLLLDLVDAFTEPGELVYDPFAGGATTGIACLRRGRRAVLIERDAKHVERAAKRLEAEVTGAGYLAAERGQVGLFAVAR